MVPRIDGQTEVDHLEHLIECFGCDSAHRSACLSGWRSFDTAHPITNVFKMYLELNDLLTGFRRNDFG